MTSGATKATRLQIFSFSTPAMRAFHMSWLGFFVCFFAWFSLAPLMPVIKTEFKLTKDQIANINIAAVGITILVRLAVGPLCDKYGPAQDIHGVARTRRSARAGHRVRQILRRVPVLPAVDRRDRRKLRDHAVSHLRHVRAERGRHCKRCQRRLGQLRRRGHSIGHALGARGSAQSRIERGMGWRMSMLVPRGVDADRGGDVLQVHPRLPARELQGAAPGWHRDRKR